MKEYVFWGTKKGEPDFMEEVLLNVPKGMPRPKKNEIEKVKKRADKKGYDRVRLGVVDMNKPPDFLSTIKGK